MAAGRPKSNEESEPKQQVLISKKALKMAKLAAINQDISLSKFVAEAIVEKINEDREG